MITNFGVSRCGSS